MSLRTKILVITLIIVKYLCVNKIQTFIAILKNYYKLEKFSQIEISQKIK